ncbi:hypothetical protein CDV31_017170 [Fusarium ambrosium]|uniref:Protein kinase domain-containing protein n=1 Tax=Fusarium ambrosium TaxID=131363 RepID=A0A428RQQ3_9HYPO|nr:hypothetical protein CDV31_017170 [Fusarium ambrosium]
MASEVTTSAGESFPDYTRPPPKSPIVQNYNRNHDSLGGLSDGNGPREAETALFNSKPIPINTVNILESKGDFIGGGATGLVERLESGDVVKTAWTGRPTESDCKQEIAIEAQVYDRLGAHRRLVQLKHWDPVSSTLTLEYMPHGTLKEYVTKNGRDISQAQRRQWAAEAAEAMELLHSHGVLHADVGPHNFLLDAELSLRICDFGGSSLDGSRAMVIPGVRYRLPIPAGRPLQPTSVKEDLFALGSTIYFIVTGREPYTELGDDEKEVQKRYGEGVFPDLAGVPFGETIALCWRQGAKSARMVLELLQCPSSGTM